MSQPELVEREDRLEIRSPMRVGMRILLAALGLFPLLAPYELLIEIDWEHFMNPFFFLAALISAGAMALSAFLFFGRSRRLELEDRLRQACCNFQLLLGGTGRQAHATGASIVGGPQHRSRCS